MGNYLSLIKYVSYRDIIDFALFRARVLAASKLNTGHLDHQKHVVDLTFYDGTFKYVIRFPRKRGPCPFNRVFTRSRNGTIIDVTDRIREFAGPCHNFYGIPTTPNMLGYVVLSFCLIGDDGEDIQLEFSGDSEIVLSNPVNNQNQKMATSSNEPVNAPTISGSPSGGGDDGKVVSEPPPASVRTDPEADRDC